MSSSDSRQQPQPLMTYHDNKVKLDVGGGYRLVSGKFIVDGYKITSGQDPENRNWIGMEKEFGADGEINFSVGRNSSEDVAIWFKGKAPARKNTFGDQPGELNFAFKGTLLLILQKEQNGYSYAYIFPDIVFAQGHTGTANNWWFGGQDSYYLGDHRVTCGGTIIFGGGASMEARRGGNEVNVIQIRNILDVNLTNWMRFFQDTALGNLTLPGSHDAGMGVTHHCAFPIGVPNYAKTQNMMVRGQLLSGVRYLDLRIDYDHDSLVTYHREGAWGCNGQSLIDVLSSVALFLTDHDTEVVILKFSHIRDYGDHDPRDIKGRINALVDFYNSFFPAVIYKSSSGDLLNLKVGDAAGKAILVFDYDEYISPEQGKFRYGGPSHSGAHLKVYDSYSNTQNFSSMKADQISKWRENNNPGVNHIFLLSWTLTPMIESAAIEANEKLESVLKEYSPTLKRPGIVFLDKVSSVFCAGIVYLNWPKS